jgi:hypothetical protein
LTSVYRKWFIKWLCCLPTTIQLVAIMTAMRLVVVFNIILALAQASRLRFDQKLGLYLNIPTHCGSIYNSIIHQLEFCRDGVDLGDPNLDHGCLIQISLDPEQKQCVYDRNGNVRRPDSSFGGDFQPQTPTFTEFNTDVVNARLTNPNQERRPTRKEIVDFLLGLLDESEQ